MAKKVGRTQKEINIGIVVEIEAEKVVADVRVAEVSDKEAVVISCQNISHNCRN